MPQITTFIAMAGLAEEAELFGLLIGWSLLIVLCLLTAVAVGFKAKPISVYLVVIAFILVCCSALLFQPWRAFTQLSDEDLADPDVIYWVGNEKVFAAAWAIVVMLVVSGLIFVCIRRRPSVCGLTNH